MADADTRTPTPFGRLPPDLWYNIAEVADFDDLIELSSLNSYMVDVARYEVEKRVKEALKANRRLQLLLPDLVEGATRFHDMLVLWTHHQDGTANDPAVRPRMYWSGWRRRGWRRRTKPASNLTDQALRESVREIKELSGGFVRMLGPEFVLTPRLVRAAGSGDFVWVDPTERRERFLRRLNMPAFSTDLECQQRILRAVELIWSFACMPAASASDPKDFDKATHQVFFDFMRRRFGDRYMQKRWTTVDGKPRLSYLFADTVRSNYGYEVVQLVDFVEEKALGIALPFQTRQLEDFWDFVGTQ